MKNLKSLLNTVIVGDVLEKLEAIPDNSIDVVITSPPYNKRKNMDGWLVTNAKYTHTDDQLPEKEY